MSHLLSSFERRGPEEKVAHHRHVERLCICRAGPHPMIIEEVEEDEWDEWQFEEDMANLEQVPDFDPDDKLHDGEHLWYISLPQRKLLFRQPKLCPSD